MVIMKKIMLYVGVAVLVVCTCFFAFFREEEIFDEKRFTETVKSVVRQRMETDFVPDVLFDDYPASAWLFAQKYGYKTYDILLGYDSLLEVASGKGDGSFTVFYPSGSCELPLPDRVVSRVHYSLYALCPYEVSLIYNGNNKELTEWTAVFKDFPVAAGSPDGRELYGTNGSARILYRLKDGAVNAVELTFYSDNGRKIKALKKKVLDVLSSLKPIRAGDWIFRSSWSVPNEWVDVRSDVGEFTYLQLRDFSFSDDLPMLKGEIVLWNGYFVEGKLYFTHDVFRKASLDFSAPEVTVRESREDNIVTVTISDGLLKDVYSYLQNLINSNNYDILRKTFLERMKKNDG